jgi:hypothetical protein
MERLERATVVATLASALQDAGSWCGETHIQKASYFLQELFEVPLGYDFVLYKHGPFSFDFHDDLTAMQGDFLLSLRRRMPGYGPSFEVTEHGARLRTRHQQVQDRYREDIKRVAEIVGDKPVSELERLATALYVIREDSTRNIERQSARIVELKPHVSDDDARSAVCTMLAVQNDISTANVG